jgi:hypothetical protein
MGVAVAAAGLAIAAFAVSARADEEPIVIGIQVSPSTVVIGGVNQWVTVHADIPYSIVAGASLSLNGIPVEWTKADSRGDLVGKFLFDSVQAIVEPGTATLKLEGERYDGTPFSGSDTVLVKNPKP